MTHTPTLTPDQLEEFGREIDAIKETLLADLGQADVDYIRGVLKAQRGMEVAGRAMLMVPPTWLPGTACLSVSKILDNMEIGHNIMHGQYEWTGDPALSGQSFEWDTACPADQWRHSHNFTHHTFTNIVGMDRDIGYGILRMSPDQPWRPYFLGNPVYAFLLMVLFQYGVALHELETERIRAGGAGIPAFFTKTGVGTIVAEGKEVRNFDGRDYVMERGIVGDFALVRAWKADTLGNLVYRKTARNFNPMMATAGKITIAEVEEIVENGQLHPDEIHTPGIYVHRLVVNKTPEKRIEQRTLSVAAA